MRCSGCSRHVGWFLELTGISRVGKEVCFEGSPLMEPILTIDDDNPHQRPAAVELHASVINFLNYIIIYKQFL